MIKKILIANRGEIAVRVIRAARTLGLDTVAIYSEADRNCLHVLLADEAILIGPPEASKSYLCIDKILNAALQTGADAIHPGYGFLSENAEFAREIKKNNLIFIGPNPESIEMMGDKLAARDLMKSVGVPTVPGSEGAVESTEEAKRVAKQIGFPVILKASAGGGGKGIRVVHEAGELESAFQRCQSEGKNYFADDRVFIEKFIQNPKHIEIQVFGDQHGEIVHLFERECSIQRRHQKLIEESPSPSVSPEVREKMGEMAVLAARSVKYVGAGTVEFIFDNSTKDFYFMEMNTRLQVEHPVTEMTTGEDLVHEQIMVAQGYPLSFSQATLKQYGHAIELRICAEDPVTFAPSPGKVRRCRIPQGPFVRVDGHIYPGYEIPVYYDPMVAKLIAWGHTREECIMRLERAMAEFMLTGVKTNMVLLRNILQHKKFRDGTYTTQFIESELSKKKSKDLFMFVDDHVFIIAAAIEAYKKAKLRDVSKYSGVSRWKQFGLFQQVRK